MYPIITLKPGKQDNLYYRHPWVFSGAIDQLPKDVKHGDLIHVADNQGNVLGTGTYSAKTMIAIRVFDFSKTEIDEAWFAHKLQATHAMRLRLGYGPATEVTGYRVIFGEADGIPGLVLDRYNDTWVLQISTMGMDRLKDVLLAALIKNFAPACIVERSDIGVRKEEGLRDEAGILHGELLNGLAFTEYGAKFLCDPLGGQKTGFFLDQKDLRQEIQKLSRGKRVLNLFSYSGAHSVAALRGGAAHITNVDSSDAALELCRKQHALNELAEGQIETISDDCFQWLSAQTDAEAYDLVILDPPALIKSKNDIADGQKAYHFLNRAALRLLKEGGLLISSSCSHFLPETDLRFILRRASVQNQVALHPVRTVLQSPDHPWSLYFPESLYLKTLISLVQR